jgi:tetratricopeptide (TPR) repeat protein
MTAADKYYLKAKENYPYNLDDVLEALEYGLSCDNEHPGLLTLMATIYERDLKQFNAAREQYELALFYDNTFVDAYYAYIQFALRMNDDKKAARLIASAMHVAGIDKARILYLRALLHTQQGQYASAIADMKAARQHCQCKDGYSFYTKEQERIEQKQKDYAQQYQSINVVLVK